MGKSVEVARVIFREKDETIPKAKDKLVKEAQSGYSISGDISQSFSRQLKKGSCLWATIAFGRRHTPFLLTLPKLK